MADDGQQQEQRLARALLSRGWIVEADLRDCRSDTSDAGAKPLLRRLVKAGFLTAHQAKRILADLPVVLDQRIPGYLLLEKIGEGSIGEVYRATQVSMNRDVAIKILHERLARNKAFVKRFEREAHIAAKLSHNNIIQAIDVGAAGELHFFVMELVQGQTLREQMQAGKVFEEQEAVEIVLQITKALEHAHSRGLIHRDIKPANIVMTDEGTAKLADLGMARETSDQRMARRERGLTIGTPYYMAPEQVRGQEDIDARADLYSLGATLYHMVTGRPPFPGDDIDSVLDAHLKEELTPPDHINQRLSGGFGEVVEWLMAKNRKKRYASAADLRIDLECVLAGDPPRLARKQIDVKALEELAEDEDEFVPDDEEMSVETMRLILWVLAVALGISLLGNLVLLVR